MQNTLNMLEHKQPHETNRNKKLPGTGVNKEQ